MLTEHKTELAHYFLDGKCRLQGEYKKWHENGQLKRSCFYVDGELHGEYKGWSENGVLTAHSMCTYGVWNGFRKTWHNNGQMHYHTHYVNDKLHGEYKCWFESGTVLLHCFYVNGVRASFREIPFPETPEEIMLFKLKYNLPLLPVETMC